MSQDNHPHDTAPTPIHNSVGRKKGGNDEVHSVSDFIEKIAPILEECNGSEIFYRGHADISWKLQPSIFRKSNKEEKEDQSNGVGKEHLLFRDMVAHTPQSFSGCKSALDYLVQMQHYELPTRLLDVSTNPLVALYFACQSAEDLSAGIQAGATKGVKVFDDIILEESAHKEIDSRDHNWLVASAYIVGALAGASEASSACVEELTSVQLSSVCIQDSKTLELVDKIAKSIAVDAAKEGAKARVRDGAVYLFSIPEDRTKHYDSDTVSVLANLVKCSDREIDIYTEQTKGVVKAKVLEQFNKRAGIQILLRQIKEEKPYFDPLIRPNDLSSIFLVKAKYGNPRIINQAGAFFIFGLGLIPSAEGRGGRLTKRVDLEIPSDWIRYKFIIPKEKKPDILDELARMGITESYLFPEMDRYAKELKKKYKLE